MQPQTVIVIGPSGSGKGTQAALLREFFEQQEPARKVLHVQVGKPFRELAEKKNDTAKLLRGYINEGILVPEFLTVWAWGESLVELYGEEKHLIFDGTPRRMMEATILHGALQFYGRKNVFIIVLEASREWSRKLLAGRGRRDDIDPEDVERRLDWYDSDVVPIIEFFKNDNLYRVVSINGERSVEDVHHDIAAAISERHG